MDRKTFGNFVRIIHKHWRMLIVCAVLLFFYVSCRHIPDFGADIEIVERKNITDFTVHESFLYFGAGFNLCRVDLSSQSYETLYTTDSSLVDQPVVDNGIVYVGGSGGRNKEGQPGSKSSFFALDIQTKEVIWKFEFPSSFGTYGTYPILVNNKIIVCGRDFLYCLDMENGEAIWEKRNWFGLSAGAPCVVGDDVVYRINTEVPNSGSWAVVSLDEGKQVATIPGKGISLNQYLEVVYDGVQYLTTEYKNPAPRYGYDRVFEAVDIINKKLLWQVGSDFSHSRPTANDSFVYTCKENLTSTHMKLRQDLGDFSQQSDFKKATKILTEIKKSFQSVVALNKQTGDLVWEKPIEGYIPRTERPEDFYDLRKSIRLAATEDEVFVRGVKTIAAFDAKNGDELWSRDSEPDFNIANPIIIDSNVYISDLSDSSIIAIDIKSGDELWRSKVPDCSFYVREEY